MVQANLGHSRLLARVWLPPTLRILARALGELRPVETSSALPWADHLQSIPDNFSLPTEDLARSVPAVTSGVPVSLRLADVGRHASFARCWWSPRIRSSSGGPSFPKSVGTYIKGIA